MTPNLEYITKCRVPGCNKEFVSSPLDIPIIGQPNARVVIVTDRDELDKQIESVFIAAGHPIARTSSGRDLMTQLSQATPRLLCSLVH